MRIVILLAALAGCAPVPPADTPAVGTPCSATLANSLVSKPYSADVVEKARIASGSKTVRVIRPGMAVTMDFREDRLNVDLDEKDLVVRVHCG